MTSGDITPEVPPKSTATVREESLPRLLTRWFVTLELIGVIGLALALTLMRACA